MLATLVRSLALAGGLLLVLPPGWCCVLQRQLARKAPARQCCRCPLCKTRPHRRPAPEPAPVHRGKCPCHDRDSTAPDSPKPPVKAVDSPAGLVSVEHQPATFDRDGPGLPPAFVCHAPLHLRLCLWLC